MKQRNILWTNWHFDRHRNSKFHCLNRETIDCRCLKFSNRRCLQNHLDLRFQQLTKAMNCETFRWQSWSQLNFWFKVLSRLRMQMIAFFFEKSKINCSWTSTHRSRFDHDLKRFIQMFQKRSNRVQIYETYWAYN